MSYDKLRGVGKRQRTSGNRMSAVMRQPGGPRAYLRGITAQAAPRNQVRAYRPAPTARRVETGFIDTNFGGVQMNNVPANGIEIINAVPAGTGVTQRIGKKISLKSMQIRVRCYSDGPTFVGAHAYIAVVYDRRPQGTLPGRDAIYNSADPTAMANDQWSGRFRILKRWDFDVAGNTASVGNVKENSVECFNDFVSLKGLVTISKTGTTGAVGDLEQGALYLIYGSNEPTGTSLKIFGNTRVRFVDN